MGGKRSKKKQLHVKNIATRTSPAPALTLVSPPRADDSHENATLLHGGSSEESLGDDSIKGASMKGGCGKLCRHLEKGVNVDKLSSQLAKSKVTLTQCQDCNKDSKSGMGKKGKGRSTKKKLVQNSSLQNEGHGAKKWVCLACGHVGCGRISSTVPSHSVENSVEEEENGGEHSKEEEVGTGHAWKHSLLAKHPLAVQSGDKLVCWCFQCNASIDDCFPVAASSEPSEAEDSGDLVALAPPGSGPLQQAVKLVREKLGNEAVLFKDAGRNDSVFHSVKAVLDAKPNLNPTDSPDSVPLMNGHSSGSQRKRVVKGLMNLGNTCFFNSVMQNLLALDLVRDYFSQDSQVAEGPLTSSLRRLYLETNSDGLASKTFGQVDMSGFESGLKRGGKGRVGWESSMGGAYNPRTLFGAICAKAPRFRGFQQQDSHELLRCLLDGLNTEDRSNKASGGEFRKVGSLGKGAALLQAGSGDDRESLEEENGTPNVEKPINAPVVATFVEQFFGGQLSSTVCCCECGHSSVVYEPFLDLSLQIPTKQSSKKAQGRASQLSSSYSGGRSEKVPLQRDVKSTRVLEKIGSSESSQSSRQVVTEHKEVHTAELPSAPSMHIESFDADQSDVAKAGLNGNDFLDDLGWLDYVGGGMQSAEGSLQGPHDVTANVQVTENPVAADAESSISENTTIGVAGFQPIVFDRSSSLHSVTLADPKAVDKGEGGETVGTFHDAVPSPISHEDVPSPTSFLVDSSGGSAQRDATVDAPGSGQEVGDDKLVIQLGEEDEPLPLASGVLLLPYEKLQLPSDLAVEETLDCAEVAECNFEESSCLLQGEDRDTALSLFVQQDDGDFDGFSQLFEEEEEGSLSVKDKQEEVREDVDTFQMAHESSMDGSWEADTGVYAGGESDLLTVGPQKLIEYQDAILPMSLEGCLADFTKSELLSGENAWGCENCSRILKESLSQLPTDIEGKKSEHYLHDSPVTSNEGKSKLGKGKSQKDGKDVFQETGKDVSSSGNYSNGEISHLDSVNDSVMSCLPNYVRGSSVIPLEAKDFSGSLLGCCSEVSCNGNITDSSPKIRHGNLCTGQVEVNPRMGNGSARLNELDSGQLSGGQSPSCGTDFEVSNGRDQGNCNERLDGMPPNKSGCPQKIETAVEELQQHNDRGQDSLEGDQSEKIERLSAQSSGKKHVQVDFIRLGDMHSGASSSTGEGKFAGPFRISGKTLKSQRGKSRKAQHEGEKVVKRDATKRLLISKAPPILTIHLKRFAQDIRGRLSKLSGHVAFPEWLDLRPFLDSKCIDRENCVYRLIGIVEHGGTMRGGHYIAYVRGPPSDEIGQETDRVDHGGKSSWYCISDSSVRKSTLQAVLNSEAYLLFYEKCKIN